MSQYTSTTITSLKRDPGRAFEPSRARAELEPSPKARLFLLVAGTPLQVQPLLGLRELFLRDMHRALSSLPSTPTPRTAHYSLMVHNAALALTYSEAYDPGLKDIQYRRIFASKAG
ncbi:hypothetical protein LXA43DRAFT_1064224 [Ganoderma leucocontextum]|nr:hypothetical protein LXA43DRAFT_1064224 [Ganoderma leucocontextum]